MRARPGWRGTLEGMTIPQAWSTTIDRYLSHERAAGVPATTQRTRREHLQHLGRHVGVGPLEVDGDDLRDWAGEQTWAPETRRGRRTTFRSFFGWMMSEGLRDEDPSIALPRVKPVEGIARPAPDRVYLEALMRSSPTVRLWLRLAGEVGMRRGEIAVVHADDLQDDLLGVSLLVHGKGRRERMLPLPPGLAAELVERIAEAGGGFAFPGDRDGHVSPEYVGKRTAAVLEGAWTLHTLRHRFAARTMDASGRDVYAVQELLGHASPATTRRYVPRAGAEHLRATVLAAAAAPSAPARLAAAR